MSERRIDAAFPAHTLHPERVLYRIHRTVNDPVYFAVDGTGRFDLTDSPGSGTCYAAPSPIGAYVETLGRLGTISEDDLAERSLSELALSRPLNLADLTDRGVLGRYGIAGDMSAGTDYFPSQQLATILDVVHSAIDALERQDFLRGLDEDHRPQRYNPERWQAYLDERPEWYPLA